MSACRQILLVKPGNLQQPELGDHAFIHSPHRTPPSGHSRGSHTPRPPLLAAMHFIADTTVPNLPLKFLISK